MKSCTLACKDTLSHTHSCTCTHHLLFPIGFELQWLTATLSNAACRNIALAGVNFLWEEVGKAGRISAEQQQVLACMSGLGDAL